MTKVATKEKTQPAAVVEEAPTAQLPEVVSSTAATPVPDAAMVFVPLVSSELTVTVPPSWALMHSGVRKGGTGMSGHAYPQRAPHFDVRPRAGGGGGGDDSGHGVEPILTISGHHGYPAAQPTEGVGSVHSDMT